MGLKKALLVRFKTGDEGTKGNMIVGSEPAFAVGELPSRDIDHDGKSDNVYSDILPGKHLVKLVKSKKRSLKAGKDVFVYELQNTDNRIAVQIHSGNFFGDTKKGFDSDIEGCLLLGEYHGKLKNKKGIEQEAILNSKPAMDKFMALMGGEDFELEIIEKF